MKSEAGLYVVSYQGVRLGTVVVPGPSSRVVPLPPVTAGRGRGSPRPASGVTH